jgi:hypothetical protein
VGTSTAQWGLENRIVYVRNVGQLTAADFHEVDRQIIALMRAAPAPYKVHVAVDCTLLKGLPAIYELEGGRILKYFKQPNCATTVVISPFANPFLNVLSKLLTGIAGASFTMAKSTDQAALRFKQVDPSLPDLEILRGRLRAIVVPVPA